MATVKLKFRPSSVLDKEGTLFYQVIHDRVVRCINTGYKLFPSEWDKRLSLIIIPADDAIRAHYLVTMRKCILEDQSRLREIVLRLKRTTATFTSEDVVKSFQDSLAGGFLSFGRELVMQLEQVGKERTAETYTVALNSFERFMGRRGDILIESIDSVLMVEYETYLKSAGVCPNSSSYYMRNLRAIYNRAVDKELTVQRNPFKYVYTGIDKTMKRAVPIKVIRQIRDLELKFSPSMDYARDIFMFSFYTRGMSFVDIAFLKKKDIRNGILSYRRHKTNQQLFIKWEKPMQEIINKYDTVDTPYLLPIIKDIAKDERRQYQNAAHLINRKLKMIGKLLNLNVTLTTYVARHAWASIAKSKNISISVICEAMGHDSENTTKIYLASLDTSVIDKANSLIINSL